MTSMRSIDSRNGWRTERTYFEGLQLQLGVDAFGVEAVGLVADEFDRLEEAAGRLALPDFAEAALAERFEQPVAGQGFRLRLQKQRHPGGPRNGAVMERRFLPG